MKELEFSSKQELFEYLRNNHDKLKAQKKEEIKHADAVDFINVVYSEKDLAYKAETPSTELSKDEIQVKVVINTTNLIDSHMDCHIDGLWKKSIAENKKVKLLREHKATFDNVISRNVVATTKKMDWKTLGYDFEGKTEALIFDATIKEEESSYMFEQYKKGYVDNHSVGMKYVNLFLCINSDDKYDKEYKENWDKYIGFVANKDVAKEYGYFWAVTEAKMVEGSAVLFGSNYATPTLSVKTKEDEPKITPNEPINTQKSIFEKFEFIN